MAFEIKITVDSIAAKQREFPLMHISLTETQTIFRREFPTLTKALEYVLGPAEGSFEHELANSDLAASSWSFRWFEILGDGSHKQLENVRHFYGAKPMDDGLLKPDKGPFPLDRKNWLCDEEMTRIANPDWHWGEDERFADKE